LAIQPDVVVLGFVLSAVPDSVKRMVSDRVGPWFYLQRRAIASMLDRLQRRIVFPGAWMPRRPMDTLGFPAGTRLIYSTPIQVMEFPLVG